MQIALTKSTDFYIILFPLHNLCIHRKRIDIRMRVERVRQNRSINNLWIFNERSGEYLARTFSHPTSDCHKALLCNFYVMMYHKKWLHIPCSEVLNIFDLQRQNDWTMAIERMSFNRKASCNFSSKYELSLIVRRWLWERQISFAFTR